MLHARVERTTPGFALAADLRIEEGITALFGPSGAGKTTLLHCLAGLANPDAGRIVRDGEVLFDAAAGVNLPPERRRVGFVFQDLRLFPHLTVEQNLEYGWRRLPRGGRRVEPGRVRELLELDELRFRPAASLSGGEARRVALGRALLASPALLLLDEPLAGLDDARQGVALRLIAQVQSEFRIPTLFVSHSLPEILQLTTRIAVLDRGRLIGQGELSEVLGHEEVFRLADSLGLESLLEVEVLAHGWDVTRARLGSHEVSVPTIDREPGTRGLVGVRPEDVVLARGPVEGISAQNALSGTVTQVTRLSDRVLVTVDVGAPLRAEITRRSERELGIAPGARIWCLVKVFSFRWRRLPDS